MSTRRVQDDKAEATPAGCLAPPEAEQKNQPRRKMMLVSDNPSHPTEAICVTGTRSSIIQAARRMATRTRGCVSISQIVWQYHRAGCDDGSEESPGTEGVDWTAGEGSEAEELRQGIECIASDDDMTSGQIRRALRDLLDEVDARDSLAHLENRQRASDSPGDVPPQTAIAGIGETVDGGFTSRERERFGITPDVEDAAVAAWQTSTPRPGVPLPDPDPT